MFRTINDVYKLNTYIKMFENQMPEKYEEWDKKVYETKSEFENDIKEFEKALKEDQENLIKQFNDILKMFHVKHVKEEVKLEDMSIKEVLKTYLGDPIYMDKQTSYPIQNSTAAVTTLVGMVKERNTEIRLLKDKIEFLEKILNQIFDKTGNLEK